MLWVDAFKLGSTVHHARGNVEITPQFASELIANFAAIKSRGYAVTVLREHGRVDSYIYGDVLELRVDGEYIQCGVEFTREEERQAVRDKLLREFSPGFDLNWMDPHTGEKLGVVLLEISFTSMAYQRNLRTPSDANPELSLSGVPIYQLARGTIMDTEEKVEMAEPTMMEVMALLTKILEKLEAAPVESEEVEMAAEEEAPVVAQMSARIAQLEGLLVRQELSAHGITKNVDQLVKLSRTDAGLYRETVKMLSRRDQVEIGVTGATETAPRKLSAADVANAAKSAGKSDRGLLPMFLSANYPEFVNKISDVRKHL